MTGRPIERSAVAASESHAADAARALITAGAIDAVVAGVFAAAAASRGVLLGPVQLLLGGPGMGLRAVDGRPRQPGEKAQRPRGFLAGEAIPAAARVAAPALVATLTATLATSGNASLSKVMAPALAIAKSASDARSDVMKLIARRGAAAFTDDAIARELTAAAGRLAGGVLTQEDLATVRPEVTPLPAGLGKARRVIAVPWGGATGSIRTHVVAAVDARGRAAIACYEIAEEGLWIESLDLVAPPFAEPVLRGQTRVRPGDIRPAAAPIMLVEAQGALESAWGLPQTGDGDRFEALATALQSDTPFEEGLGGASGAVGVAWSRTGARAFGGG